MTVKRYPFGSAEYDQSLDLREKVLRKPLGMVLNRENLAAEESDVHLGAFIESRLVGCLVLTPVPETKALKMRQVAVDSEFQGKGIGAEMVRFSEDFAQKEGYQKMVLHARKVVLGFYLSLGYKAVGEEFEEIGIPHFKMEKEMA